MERAEENVVTGFRNTIVESIEDISRAVSADAVWEAVKTFAKPYGFDYMLVLKAKDSMLEGVSGAVLYSDMPAGFAEAFDAAGFSRDNPLVSHAIVEPRPYSAAELWTMPLTVRQRRALAQLNLSLDVLDGLPELKICTGYKLDGHSVDILPMGAEDIARCEPIYETLPGWSENLEQAAAWNDLPAAAQRYIRRLEELAGVPVTIISVGPDRDQTIMRQP